MRNYRETMGLREALGLDKRQLSHAYNAPDMSFESASANRSRNAVENYDLRAQHGDALYRQETQHERPEQQVYVDDVFGGTTETIPAGIEDYIYNDSAMLDATGRADDTFTNTLFAQDAPPYTGGFDAGQRISDSRFNADNRFEESKQYLAEERALADAKRGQWMTGAGIAAGVGGLGAITNAVQGDSNGNILINPVTGALATGALGAGAGALVSGRTVNPIMDEIMQRKLERMGDEKFAEYYGKNKGRIARKEQDLGIRDLKRRSRLSGRNIAVGAGAGTLLSLLSQLGYQGE